LSYIKQVSPLLRSRIYIGLGVAFAECGQKQEALCYINLAFKHFPQYPEKDESFLYADFSLAELILWEGLAYLALSNRFPNQHYDRKSWETFAKIEDSQPISERVRIEIINHQADAALALRDLELFCAYMQQGIKRAKRLNSQRRRQEAIATWKNASHNIWLHDSQVRGLVDLF
jgi:tetratricopeptide (TPR) repeat protein